jgi:hypothetical protein
MTRHTSVRAWVAGAAACALVLWWFASAPESGADLGAALPGAAQLASSSTSSSASSTSSSSGMRQAGPTPAKEESSRLASAVTSASEQGVQVREGTPPPPLPPALAAASPQQRAAADALLQASFQAVADSGPQPGPVELRRNMRSAARSPDLADVPVTLADVGLPAYPGATTLSTLSGRQGQTVTLTLVAQDSLPSVRAFYAARLQSDADHARQVTVLRDDGLAYHLRLVDLNDQAVQQVRLAASDAGAVVQLSRFRAR